MEIYRRIGERIRHARLEVGLTQPALAEMLNVSKGIISRWEMGLARPSLDRLEPLAQRLGVSVEQMLGFTMSGDVDAYRSHSVPVWALGGDAVPDLEPESSIGHVLVNEDEAFSVQGAFYVRDSSLCPYLLPGDVVGIHTASRPKLGDVIFIQRDQEVLLRRYGGMKKGIVLLPLEFSQDPEIVDRVDFLGTYRWLRRPGKVIVSK